MGRKKTHRRKKIWNRRNQRKVLLKENVHLGTKRLPPSKRKIKRTRKEIGKLRVVRKKKRMRKMMKKRLFLSQKRIWQKNQQEREEKGWKNRKILKMISKKMKVKV